MIVPLLSIIVIFAAVTMYALEKKSDVEVSLSLMRRWFQFTLTARERTAARPADTPLLTDSKNDAP